jgi:hypothetical protein
MLPTYMICPPMTVYLVSPPDSTANTTETHTTSTGTNAHDDNKDSKDSNPILTMLTQQGTLFAANQQDKKHPGDITRMMPTSNARKPPSMVVIDGHTYSIKMHRITDTTDTNGKITYQTSSTSSHQHGALIDRGSNGGVAGDDVRVIRIGPHRTVDVQGIANHRIINIRIVTAGALVDTNRGPIILIMNQYAHGGKGKTIHCSGQMEWFKNTVDDRSKKVGGSQRVTTPDGYIIPISIISGLPYIKQHPYTDDRYDTQLHCSSPPTATGIPLYLTMIEMMAPNGTTPSPTMHLKLIQCLTNLAILVKPSLSIAPLSTTISWTPTKSSNTSSSLPRISTSNPTKGLPYNGSLTIHAFDDSLDTCPPTPSNVHLQKQRNMLACRTASFYSDTTKHNSQLSMSSIATSPSPRITSTPTHLPLKTDVQEPNSTSAPRHRSVMHMDAKSMVNSSAHSRRTYDAVAHRPNSSVTKPSPRLVKRHCSTSAHWSSAHGRASPTDRTKTPPSVASRP